MTKISDSGSNLKKDIPLQWCPGGYSDTLPDRMILNS
jgi:hypothetical protein